MKVGVIGSRGFNDYDLLCKTLSILEIDTIVSGGAKGADNLAEQYAKENNLMCIVHPIDWNFGRGGPAIRNAKIVEDSDIIVAFWDGKSKGTNMTMNMAKKKGKNVNCINYTTDL